MYPGEIPSYSPPARSFFTPPLPPEYQNPFADKPTLRGTNNDGLMPNAGSSYINRRPIPPPSLMPGHERIPYRPPDLAASTGSSTGTNDGSFKIFNNGVIPIAAGNNVDNNKSVAETDGSKKALNTVVAFGTTQTDTKQTNESFAQLDNSLSTNVILPSIRRILSGSNGKKSKIPEELLKQVTSRPIVTSQHQPPSSPVVLLDSNLAQDDWMEDSLNTSITNQKINMQSKQLPNNNNTINGNKKDLQDYKATAGVTTTTIEQFTPDVSITDASSSSTSTYKTYSDVLIDKNAESDISSTSSSTHARSKVENTAKSSSTNWSIAWNIHIYLSTILFTILAVYIFYKILTYNKLTHLFSQSYFICIHLLLLIICASRIFYLCYDAYNIHGSFELFISDILLNLPATLLTICFAVLMLFLFLKSLNHKNNRYSALIRPLTVVVGCGVHVVLCITLHYVESYTMQNQQLYIQQQQHIYRKQQQQNMATLMHPVNGLRQESSLTANNINLNSNAPPRVLSLICQLIYIFICLSLGLLYLYLYRILKRILRSKSQNYIHGYQNLSYAIHITIATALLYILLASLQIFGAIALTSNKALITQHTLELDWLQWSYQFSLRLIEIAIITLISWVVGLKTNGSNTAGINLNIRNPETNTAGERVQNLGVFGGGHASTVMTANRPQKSTQYHGNHSNVAGFFLPCTSSSSQEHFETDYPAVCNANTNLHNYTLRTGNKRF